MPWDPEQYRKFQSERFAPFADLFDMIDVRPGLRVVDLGCGTGELTARLAEQLPGSDVLGIDASPQMLAQAQSLARPRLKGTALVPYLERLPSDLREPFMTRYREKLRARWPEAPVFYPFRRTLFVAKRP